MSSFYTEILRMTSSYQASITPEAVKSVWPLTLKWLELAFNIQRRHLHTLSLSPPPSHLGEEHVESHLLCQHADIVEQVGLHVAPHVREPPELLPVSKEHVVSPVLLVCAWGGGGTTERSSRKETVREIVGRSGGRGEDEGRGRLRQFDVRICKPLQHRRCFQNQDPKGVMHTSIYKL